MLVLSKFPIDTRHARTFQHFRWADMPNAMLPDDPATPGAEGLVLPGDLDVLRLSSKSHWDLPIWIGRSIVQFLVSTRRRPPSTAPGPQRHAQPRRDPLHGRLRRR
jgi:hypothetical protein